jgi:hypothetical protein
MVSQGSLEREEMATTRRPTDARAAHAQRLSALSVVRIAEVEGPSERPGLWGASVDVPRPGATFDTYAFDIGGSVATERERVACVDVRERGRLILEAPASPVRSEGASGPAARQRDTFEFQATVKATELSTSFDLHLGARFESGDSIPIGNIRGGRQALPSNAGARIQPAMLTTIGRSGSKWLAWLLSNHPQIVAFNPLVFEPRVATYWMSVFRDLSAPSSFLRQLHNDDWTGHWWLRDDPAELPAPVGADLESWLGTEAIESLAAMCQMRIEAFYGRVAASVGKPASDYFVEKFLLQPVTLDLMAEIYPRAREVILVRDFRDRLSSVLAWNAKRGRQLFGRDSFSSDAEFVTSRLRTEARSLLRHWRDRKDRAFLLRYEDLILEPRPALTGLLDFLGVDSSLGTVEATLQRASQKSTLLDLHRTVTEPSASIGRWRRDLSPQLADLCNEVLGPTLLEFGYDVNDGRESSAES